MRDAGEYHREVRWKLLLVVFIGALAVAGGAGAAEPARNPPNIVLLLTDDQRFDALGFLHPVLETPSMDHLASSGVWFANAFATTPICLASRATILTGLHERTHALRPGQQIPIALLETSYPRLLRDAGYVTALIGRNGVHLDAQRRELLYDHFLRVDGSPYIQVREEELIHATDYIADKAVEFISDRGTDQPWQLTVAFYAPHADDVDPQQFVPPERYSDLYQGINHPDPPLSDPAFFDGLPVFLRDCLNRERWFWRWTPDLYDGMLSSYLAMVRGIDDAVGQILTAIDDGGFADDTVVILVSDHGTFIGERGYAGKWLGYEPSIRMPLIILDPRAPRTSGVVVELVLNLDLPETILELAGLPIPDIMQGRSLVPLLHGEVTDWRTDTLIEHSWTSPPEYVIPRHEGLRTAGLKYINYIDHGREELYELVTDPDESVDLVADPGWSSELEVLRDRTAELRDLYAGLIFRDGFEDGDPSAWVVAD